MQELLEGVHPGQALEQALRVLTLHPLGEAARLDRLPQPEPLLGVVDVPEVVAGGVAVDLAQLVDGLPGGGGALGYWAADDESGQRLQVLVGDPVEGRVERRVPRRLAPERVEPRGPVPEVPYVPDVLGGPDGLLHVHLGGHLLAVGRGHLNPRRAPGLEELPRPPVD